MKISFVPFFTGRENTKKIYDITVLFDVFRATSTMAVLKSRGCGKIYVTGTIKGALNKKKEKPDIFVCGERKGFAPKGFDAGNSPVEILNKDLTGRQAVMTTSNGTRALKAFRKSSQVFIGASVINMKRVEEFLLDKGFNDILFLCAGNGGFFSFEDFLTASLMLYSIKKKVFFEENDIIKVALETGQIYYGKPELLKKELKTTDHAKILISKGLEKDVNFIADGCDTILALPEIEVL